MTPFTTLTGPAIPLLIDNIDTDVIIRIERLTNFSGDELGPYAFEAIRLLPDGTEDPHCVMNQTPYRSAPILLAGANFGCGSSREAAVWALAAMGISCIIAPSYGDIFLNNCFQNGILPIQLPAHELLAIQTACDGGGILTVDLSKCSLILPDRTKIVFAIDPIRKQGLLSGLDEIGITLKDDVLICQWQRDDRTRRPWAWPRHFDRDLPPVVQHP